MMLSVHDRKHTFLFVMDYNRIRESREENYHFTLNKGLNPGPLGKQAALSEWNKFWHCLIEGDFVKQPFTTESGY